jgi:hypothetical protein
MRLKNGWKASDLPWTYDLDPARMALPERETRTLHPGNRGAVPTAADLRAVEVMSRSGSHGE